MKCGSDSIGGNVQNGCGKPFSWPLAAIYVPQVAPIEEEEIIQEPMPDKIHEFYLCDVCHAQISGLRFTCLNCPHFSLCGKCEVKFSEIHDKFHVFQIVE